MTQCITKRWDLVEINIPTLCQEIEDFCNLQEVKVCTAFIFGRHLVLIAIFKTDKDKED